MKILILFIILSFILGYSLIRDDNIFLSPEDMHFVFTHEKITILRLIQIISGVSLMVLSVYMFVLNLN